MMCATYEEVTKMTGYNQEKVNLVVSLTEELRKPVKPATWSDATVNGGCAFLETTGSNI